MVARAEILVTTLLIDDCQLCVFVIVSMSELAPSMSLVNCRGGLN